MSVTYQRLIPTDPAFVPSPEAREMALAKLEEFIGEPTDAKSVVTDEVRFIDQGSNWVSLSCPNCGSELKTPWWQAAMDTASRTRFADLMTTCPACHAPLSLNDLKYDWPAGFARFMLEADGGRRHRSDWLTAVERQELEAILGCRLREIWSHY